MFNLLRDTIFGRAGSKNTAKNRLQMVLIQDRSGLNPQEMDLFRKELIEVISKYFLVDKKQLDIEWERNDFTTALLINTPVIGRKSELKQPIAAAS